ncbi:MAG TPA: helix-turn-helix domain-containing protein [Novosphingobium sp.]|nr:helix-turn-helix domain-containing protein [Novosphingobium sp.]
MRKKNPVPGIDKAIAPQSGVSRDGQPLSYNRAPRNELAPWIGRLYVSDVAAPDGHRLECGLFNDTSMLRVQLSGQWRAETIAGPMELGRAALYFGPQSRRMAVAVTGPFCSVGVALRPGACHALRGPKAADHLDRISGTEVLGLAQDAVLAQFEPDMGPEAMLQVMEGLLMSMVERCATGEPDPLTARFENAAFLDPTISISQFARECGVDQRRLERVVRRDFGMAPKQVLRRARALDMASHLRGVADQDEAEELALRYYDQSHLIREFIELFGMSPSQFVARPQPLLTLALESRQARRLEAIARIAPGDLRPWQ